MKAITFLKFLGIEKTSGNPNRIILAYLAMIQVGFATVLAAYKGSGTNTSAVTNRR